MADFMDLSELVAKDNASAVALVKTVLSQPALILDWTDNIFNVDFGDDAWAVVKQRALDAVTALAAPYMSYIPIEVKSVHQTGRAEVSENLIIAGASGKGSRQYIADNVAPGPWEWTLDGYIPGDSLIEHTARFTPIVGLNRMLVRLAYMNGLRLFYKDLDCVIYDNVVIQSLDIGWDPEVQNKTPVSMTLKRVNIQNLAEISNTTFSGSGTTVSTPASGTASGDPVNLGSGSAEKSQLWHELDAANTEGGWGLDTSKYLLN